MLVRRPVIVMQLPELLNAGEVQDLVGDLKPLLEPQRPRIVLDCSQVKRIDSAGVEMLLHCLEEAMKRDGDLKLAAVSPESRIIFDLMRVDGIFEMFTTPEEAIDSFSMGGPSAAEEVVWHPGVFNDAAEFRRAS
jgi:anti-sigma B factor antagonist